MADWLEGLKYVASSIASSDATLCVGAALAIGAIPRVGVVRALTLGWKSYFKTVSPMSVRKSEMERLNDALLRMHRGSYVVVTGGTQYGKTCMIDTALHRQHGVVKISTESGASKSSIVDSALYQLTGLLSFVKAEKSARRVVFFHSLMFKQPPTVVLHVPDRYQDHRSYADVTAAVRQLADDFGVRVVVDGVPSALPPELFATKRETVFVIGPMPREQIESVPEFKHLMDFLRGHSLDGPAWDVLGGSPLDYQRLNEKYTDCFFYKTLSDEAIVNEVKLHLQSVISYALHRDIFNSSANTKEIIKIFTSKKVNKIPLMELKALGFVLDYPNRVFHEVKTPQGWFVEPDGPAVSFLISENIRDCGDRMRALHKKLRIDTQEIAPIV